MIIFFLSQKNEFLEIIFNNDFDYIMIKDMDYLLQNGFIEKSIPKLSYFKMLKKEYINNRDIIWTLFIKCGYLIIADNDNIISNNKKLKIRNKEIKEFIEKSIYYLKDDLYNNSKYSEFIDLFIKNYDEEKIQEFLENSINKKNYSRNENLNKWYALIYSLLSLNNEYVIVIKINMMKKIIFVNYYMSIKII